MNEFTRIGIYQRIPQTTPPWVHIGSMLAEASGLVHDLGKANKWFQKDLRKPKSKAKNEKNRLQQIRHEWISIKILQHLRKNDHQWEAAWNTLSISKKTLDDVVLGDNTEKKLTASKNLSASLTQSVVTPPEAIDYLVVSHHGLIGNEKNRHMDKYFSRPSARPHHIRLNWNQAPDDDYLQLYAPLDKQLLADYAELQAKITDTGEHAVIFWRAILAYAHAALIFADHSVSKEDEPDAGDVKNGGKKKSRNPVNYANTSKKDRQLKQPLDLHLRKVANRARDTFRRMADLVALQHAKSAEYAPLPGLSRDSVKNIIQPADPESRFAWQNTCADALSEWRSEFPDSPALLFNMASTGSGKTRMNARAACLLSRDTNPRLSFALNLRSLTLQTGEALKSASGIGNTEMATIIGDRTAHDLVESTNNEPVNLHGDFDEDELEVYGEDISLPEWLERFFEGGRERTVLGIPSLVSTIDFLADAGSPGKRGRHVKALLRLMSADLVLDEIDSYEPQALVAVLRLVQLAALFRRNVICSSATLSRPVARAVDAAFRSGIAMLEALENANGEKKNTPIRFIRAFIDDELKPAGKPVASSENDFEEIYSERLDEMSKSLINKPVFRLAQMQPVRKKTYTGWMESVKEAVGVLHEDHKWTFNEEDKHVSFGLVRVANIRTAVDLARYLAKEMPHARVACYHSGDLLIARFYKEWRLDHLLSRIKGNQNIEQDSEIRSIVKNSESRDIPFIVVATPVEEIGRDHDFDLGVLDVSSAQSLVQASGRVNRHRLVPVKRPNIRFLQFNARYCWYMEKGIKNRAVFVRPGYEKITEGKSTHENHDLRKLLSLENDEWLPITASLRFDVDKYALAKCDDEAISGAITPFFGEKDGVEGCFTQDPAPSIILTSAPYDATPLRTTMSKEFWGVQQNELDDWQLMQKKLSGGKYRWVDEHNPNNLKPAPENAWFALTFDEMRNMCIERGISPDSGMYAELAKYYAYDRVEFHYAFGFKRVRK